MSHMWKKHAIGKRIIALCLLITMLLDTVTVSVMASDGEDGTQIEIVEKGEEAEVTEELETLDTQRNVGTVGEEDTENSILVETEEVGEVLVSNQVIGFMWQVIIAMMRDCFLLI